MTLKSGYVFLYVWHDGIGRNYRQSRIQADLTDLTGFCTRPHRGCERGDMGKGNREEEMEREELWVLLLKFDLWRIC